MAVGSFKLPISSGGGESVEEWVRPTDWLAMPTGITSSSQTFVGLYAIIPDNDNYAAFLFTTSTGQYQVDWGDGSTPTLHNSNTVAQYEYNFTTYDTGNTTLTSRGYKQAIITVTPVSGNLTSCDFNRRFVTSPVVQNQQYSTGFLDCILSMPNANTSTSITFGGTQLRHSYVERFEIKTIGNCQSLSNLFNACFSLQSVPLFDTSNVTSFLQMFLSCTSLKSVPLFNTSNATNIRGIFNGCRSLQEVPLISLGTATDISSLVAGCTSLKSVPLFNTANATDMQAMFQLCTSLQSVPLFNTANATTMAQMFSQCSALQSVPLFNTQNVLSMDSMFQSCTSLKSVPLFNTANATNMAGMFSSATTIQSVPLFNTANVTSMSNMFNGCISLRLVPLFNTANVTNMNQMFTTCPALQSVPLFNTANVTNMAGMFQGCTSLNSIPTLSTTSITPSTGSDFGAAFANNCVSLNRCQMIFGRAVGFASCQLSQTAIEEIFTNLTPRTDTAANISVSANWGAGTVFAQTFTTTDGSTTLTTANTAFMVAGMQLTGTGSPLTTPVAVTFQDTGDTVTLNSHGLENGDEVSFATIVTTTGLDLNTIYYIINKTTNTFQVATTSGGSALPLTTDGSGTMRHRTEIVSIVPNTSVTVSRPMRASGTVSLTFRELKTGTALLKNWTVN
jgi:surface protein